MSNQQNNYKQNQQKNIYNQKNNLNNKYQVKIRKINLSFFQQQNQQIIIGTKKQLKLQNLQNVHLQQQYISNQKFLPIFKIQQIINKKKQMKQQILTENVIVIYQQYLRVQNKQNMKIMTQFFINKNNIIQIFNKRMNVIATKKIVKVHMKKL
ncbi:hypothetical protein IMG5_162120 [Ichthyophthirius multifiliis]|uniref:Uncharacterized protein n=1 Tax=Ichthyophthirius multifiliis TaxID=5932 RepID=G0R058_ICHMU|nr:hypothetical protein IMG5_162120 [Ichthyophthirius multifiliis]EGR29157.1 hypothetical protein IMG5_162120 [Ichthyophthirius multifiliis]|eukprot:XP_004030393.1 hypothetical protein IMG5_162120 [Ichthyophthirius multifiliis]